MYKIPYEKPIILYKSLLTSPVTRLMGRRVQKDSGSSARLRSSAEVLSEDANRRIINFESARKALERAEVKEPQSPAALVDYNGLENSGSEDWLELLLTMALFFAALLGLYLGLLG